MKEEIKQYLKDNLRIYADIEEYSCKLVLTLMVGREKVSENTIVMSFFISAASKRRLSYDI